MIKYRAFIKTVELGSITKAAEFLGYSQPGLSHILTGFEKQLGFPLLIRSKSTVQATEDGKKLIPYCYKILEAEDGFNNMVDSINGIMSGSIRIGAPNSMMAGIVSKAVNEFKTVYPNIDVIVHENTLAETVKDLNNGKIDIAFLTDVSAEGCSFYPVLQDKICLVMNASHPFAQREKIAVKSLNGCAFIMPVPGWDDIARSIIDRTGVKPDIKYYTASDAASFAMVASFLGVYITSEFHKSLLPQNVVMREFEEDFRRVIGIAVKPGRTMTSAQHEFVQIVRNFKMSDIFDDE